MRFCKKVSSLVSLFPRRPIHWKVPATLVDITPETGSGISESGLTKSVQGHPGTQTRGPAQPGGGAGSSGPELTPGERQQRTNTR